MRLMDGGRCFPLRRLFSFLVLLVLAGCGGDSGTALSSDDVNLIFVVSPDLAYHDAGDVDSSTANLTSQGLQRALRMASYLKEEVLGGENVKEVFALAPMTHLQTADNYPDMAGIGYIQQFALLNRITLNGIAADSYPISTSYGPHSVPPGVVEPSTFEGLARGLAFNDAGGDNLALATRVIDANVGGFYVFSAPWETVSALLADIKNVKSYDFDPPRAFMGANFVFAVSIGRSGDARLLTFDSRLDPPAVYPVLSVPRAACSRQTPFSITRTGGVDGAVIPSNINTNGRVHLIRHAEAHPGSSSWDDGNYVGTGQWRALALPEALRGKIRPDQVYSIDPAQAFDVGGFELFSYIRPALTVLPYVIANNLPYRLVASFYLGSADDLNAAEAAKDFFFMGGSFSNQTLLVGWEHEHFPPLITALVQSYGGAAALPSLSWPDDDYDTIWTVSLDEAGNVTVDNALCEGIDTSGLPGSPPEF